MDNLQEYIKPELLVLVPVLYVIGYGVKKADFINDKYIPIILAACGMLLSTLYVLATEPLSLMGVFTAITQGVLVAGAAVFANQLYKQSNK